MSRCINIMVDIETLGLDREYSPIVEVAMVPFVNTPFGFSELNTPTHLQLSLNVKEQKRRHADEETLKKHEEWGHDIKRYLNTGVNPYEACEEIAEYVKPYLADYETVYFWCCGTDFDFPFLRYFYKQYGEGFYQDIFPFARCLDCRTIYMVAQERSDFVRSYATDNAHSALADCIWQIRELDRAYKAITGYGDHK